jgi:hypothetical protein
MYRKGRASMDLRQRQPGQHIEVVFRLFDDPNLIMPVTVVEDSDQRILHYLATGTRFLTRRMADGSPLPRVVTPEQYGPLETRLVAETWERSWQLIVTRPGRAHSIRLRWNSETDAFRGWYVNLQEPVERTAFGFATRDQFLDILVAPDRSWEWKDEDELAEAVNVGLFTPDDAAAIRAEGERLLADIEARRFPFDDSLLEWRPDPAWTLPVLTGSGGLDETLSRR